MKTDKFVTPLIAVSAIATLLFFTDVTSYALGKKSFLLGRRKSSTKRVINEKLDKISDQLLDLTTRITQVEDIVTKIDSDFSTKIITPIQKKLDDDRLKKAQKKKLVSHRGGFFKSSSGMSSGRSYPEESNKNENTDYSIFTPRRHISKQPSENSHELNSFSTDFNTGKTFSRPFLSAGRPRSYQWGDGLFAHSSENYNGRFSAPKLGFSSPRLEHNHDSMNPTRLSDGNSLNISYNPDTNQRDNEMMDRKLSVAFDSPKRTSKIPSERDLRLKLTEIFPDVKKEDPIVEVKKFNDLESFEMFHNDLKNDVVRENDGSQTSFTKMSKILGYRRPEPGFNPHADFEHDEASHKAVTEVENEIAKIGEEIEKDRAERDAISMPVDESKTEHRLGSEPESLEDQLKAAEVKQASKVSSASEEASNQGATSQDLDSIDPFDISNNQQKIESYSQPSKATLADVIKDMEAIKETVSSSNLSASKNNSDTKSLIKDSKNIAEKVKSKVSEAETKEAREVEKKILEFQKELSDKKEETSKKPINRKEFYDNSMPNLAANAIKEMQSLRENMGKATNSFKKKHHSSSSGIQEPTDQNII